MKFEYTKKYDIPLEEMPMINEMGKQGWELCAVYEGQFYFKRAVEVKNLAQPDVSGQLQQEEDDDIDDFWCDEEDKREVGL